MDLTDALGESGERGAVLTRALGVVLFEGEVDHLMSHRHHQIVSVTNRAGTYPNPVLPLHEAIPPTELGVTPNAELHLTWIREVPLGERGCRRQVGVGHLQRHRGEETVLHLDPIRDFGIFANGLLPLEARFFATALARFLGAPVLLARARYSSVLSCG